MESMKNKTTSHDLQDGIQEIELNGIDFTDAPDFCDTFIQSAEHSDGTLFTEEELDILCTDADFMYECIVRELT